MPTTITTRTTTPHLDLDARLALTDAAMTLRLETAALAHQVNTAHIPAEPVDTTPPCVGGEPAPAGQPGPIAHILTTAIRVLDTRGWAATGPTCRTPGGRLCLAGAIRLAAGHGPDDADGLLAARAASFLLDTIQAQHPTAATLPAWNDAQTDSRQPLRLLRQAAVLATAHGI
jgi:hypothetical protein